MISIPEDSFGANGENELLDMRRRYQLGELLEKDLASDWMTQFGLWFAQAEAAGVLEPNAAVFASASAEAIPRARTVLLKACDERGMVFFTNYRSQKGEEVSVNPYGSLVFLWLAMERQVVVCGAIERITREDSVAYFRTRPRGSQLAAWASPQSRVVASRQVLDSEFARLEEQFSGDTEIPVPEHWGGLRLVPHTLEFWQGRSNRLHDRLQYRLTTDGWVIERLAP